MLAKNLIDTMKRAESWPDDAQTELACYAEEIEAGLRGGAYQASAEELAGIDRGLTSVRAGRLANQERIDAVFAKHRPE